MGVIVFISEYFAFPSQMLFHCSNIKQNNIIRKSLIVDYIPLSLCLLCVPCTDKAHLGKRVVGGYKLGWKNLQHKDNLPYMLGETSHDDW